MGTLDIFKHNLSEGKQFFLFIIVTVVLNYQIILFKLWCDLNQLFLFLGNSPSKGKERKDDLSHHLVKFKEIKIYTCQGL